MLDQQVETVGQLNGGGVVAGIHHDVAFGFDLTEGQATGNTIGISEKDRDKVIKFLALGFTFKTFADEMDDNVGEGVAVRPFAELRLSGDRERASALH